MERAVRKAGGRMLDKLILKIKQLLWRLFARKNHKCRWCTYLTCVSNHSPCYTCYKFSNFERENNMSLEEMELRNISYIDIEKKEKR